VIPALQIRMHYLNKSVLGPHVTEFAILIGARHWTNNWEWNAHAPAAATAGVKPEVIAALSEGRRPDGMSEDEAIAYDVCAELQSNQSLSDGTYAKALAKFGEAGVVELASIQGYYTYLAMVMNAARVGVQQNAKPPLERFPH
jgi:4-carboxymuconolactone decarboxylase